MSGGILDDDAVTQVLQELPGWQRTGDVIAKTFVYDDSGRRSGSSTEGRRRRVRKPPS
jgi:hypothetical protein